MSYKTICYKSEHEVLDNIKKMLSHEFNENENEKAFLMFEFLHLIKKYLGYEQEIQKKFLYILRFYNKIIEGTLSYKHEAVFYIKEFYFMIEEKIKSTESTNTSDSSDFNT